MITLNEYQTLALRTQKTGSAYDREIFTALGLAGEVGEYVNQVKHEHFHGWKTNRINKLEELGDILWYLAASAAAHGATLEEIALGNIAKLSDRYPTGFDAERSQKRDPGKVQKT